MVISKKSLFISLNQAMCANLTGVWLNIGKKGRAVFLSNLFIELK